MKAETLFRRVRRFARHNSAATRHLLGVVLLLLSGVILFALLLLILLDCEHRSHGSGLFIYLGVQELDEFIVSDILCSCWNII